MERKLYHLHHRFTRPIMDLAGLGIPRGVRFDNGDGDGDGDGGQGAHAGSGGKAGQVTMSQAAFDAIIRDAKAQSKRSTMADVVAKYGDLDALKSKADSTDGAEATDALKALGKAMGLDLGDNPTPKDILAKAQERITVLVTAETEAAEAKVLDTRKAALTKAGLKPELAAVLNLKGTTEEELATEIEALKPVVGAMGQQGGGNQGQGGGNGGIGGGGNPANAGHGQPAGLNDAIGAHYGHK